MQSTKLLSIYLQPKLIVVLILGIISGMPLIMVASNFSLWLAEQGTSNTAIGLLALVLMPYSLRFLWAPLIDTTDLPLITNKYGRRIGWLILFQLLTGGSIILLGQFDPGSKLFTMAIIALLVSTCSATLDACIDGYRIAILEPSQQAAGSAMAVTGYRIGMLVSGAGGLLIAEYYSWNMSYTVIGGLISASALLTSLFATKIHTRDVAPIKHSIRARLIDPLLGIISQPGWVTVILFISLYKLGDAFLANLTSPLLVKLGYQKVEIAAIVKILSPLAVITGGMVGGVVAFRIPIKKSLVISGIMMAISNLSFWWLYYQEHNIASLACAFAVENFTTGVGSAVFAGYISQRCRRQFAATDYAVLIAAATLGRNMLSAPAGLVADSLGWDWFFTISMLLCIPGLLLIRKLPN